MQSSTNAKSAQERINVVAYTAGAANAAETQERTGHGEERPRGLHETEDEHHRDEPDRVHGSAHEGVDQLADRDVADGHRGREHTLVRLRVLELEEDVARFVDGAVHRRGREKRRRDELAVRDGLAAELERADERPDADPEGDEVEERFEEPGDDDEPGVARARQVALDEPPGAVRAERDAGDDAKSGVVGAHRRSLVSQARTAIVAPTAVNRTR